AVADVIYDHRDAFSGVSLLPAGGDLDYPQAPFVAVWTAEEIVARYGAGAIMASGLIVDGLHAFADDLWAACACALGIGEKLLPPPAPEHNGAEALSVWQEAVRVYLARTDWVRRARKFARNYFADDVREMTWCL